MAAIAAGNSHCPLLTHKLGDPLGDTERMLAVRKARPDANEGWHPSDLKDRLSLAAEVGIEVVEQPLPAQADMHLTVLASPVPLCADEPAARGTDLPQLADRYQAVNKSSTRPAG